MAGNYPDVPAPRMAYDRDGTIMFSTNGFKTGVVSVHSQANMQALNDDSSSGWQHPNGSGTYSWGFIFPQLRDISAVFYCGQTTTSPGPSIDVSADTTTGIDGTWTVLGNISSNGQSFNVVNTRQNIEPLIANGIKAVRFSAGWAGNRTQFTTHLYGGIAAGETPDRLRFWHPTLDEPLDDLDAADGAYLDWGDRARGTTEDRTFRIKNNSPTLTANSITISNEVLTNTTPTLESQITYDYDGSGFGSTANISSLMPGEISQLITVRRTTSLSAQLSLWSWRVVAEAGSWT